MSNNKKLPLRNLSKSKLMAFRQCPKRLWLEIHKQELREDSAATQNNFAVGYQVGEIARQLYDPKGKGQLIDAQSEGFDAAFARTTELLATTQPIFEAGFCASGALAFADVMLPVKKSGKKYWRMIEVKSSTEVKDYHQDDAAIQAFVAKQAGVPLTAIALALIDKKWVYPGGDDYQGLLVENDLTAEAFSRDREVATWVADAQAITRKRTEPAIRTGSHCDDPYDCGFLAYCQSQEKPAKYPLSWLRGKKKYALTKLIENEGITDMRKVPDELLNEKQLRVKKHTLSGKMFFDAKGAAADLANHKLPACFLDFETILFAVPIWKGTRPYQVIPFQFSLHKLSRSNKLEHQEFLDLSGKNPSKNFANSLIAACGERGPIFVYSHFESNIIKSLAEQHPRLKQPLLAINERLVDLYKIAKQRYYHPDQQGSWSIKAVLPTIASNLDYKELDGVQDGGMAMDAYLEAISPDTGRQRKAQIEQQLLAYCKLDTYAMVRLWQFFAGRNDLEL